MSIRSTAKAIIIDNNKILLNKCYDKNNGEYFSLPGGGQNKYEALRDAVIRECLEETGYTVNPVRFAALCEEICDDAFFREHRAEYAHKMYHIFICELHDKTKISPTETDDLQVSSEWININNIENINLLPKLVGSRIKKIIGGELPVFLGTEHIPFNHG